MVQLSKMFYLVVTSKNRVNKEHASFSVARFLSVFFVFVLEFHSLSVKKKFTFFILSSLVIVFFMVYFPENTAETLSMLNCYVGR